MNKKIDTKIIHILIINKSHLFLEITIETHTKFDFKEFKLHKTTALFAKHINNKL